MKSTDFVSPASRAEEVTYTVTLLAMCVLLIVAGGLVFTGGIVENVVGTALGAIAIVGFIIFMWRFHRRHP